MRSIKTTAQTLGVSDETPPNLKTERSASALRAQADRSSSALRGRTRRPVSAFRDRPETQNPKQTNPVVVETATKTVSRRQSCSPSVTRGRKVVSSSTEENSATTPKGKLQGQVFGSRMVDKFLTARKSSTEEKPGPVLRSRMGDRFSSTKKSSDEEKSNGNGKLYGSINESSGFGRLMAKSSLDVAVKHMVHFFVFFKFSLVSKLYNTAKEFMLSCVISNKTRVNISWQFECLSIYISYLTG